MMKAHLLAVLILASLMTEPGICQNLPPLNPIKPTIQKKAIRKNVRRKKVRRRYIKQVVTPDWNYRLSLTPSVEYIGGKKTQAERAGTKGSFSFMYGDWTFYSEGFVEIDGAPASEERLSHETKALQELNLEYKSNSFLIRFGRQPVRWSESWTMPSLDGWTARRFNRLFFDQLSEQLIHPTGTLINWNYQQFSADFFHNVEPAVNIFSRPVPNAKRIWRSEWGAHSKMRLGSGLDAEIVYFEKFDRSLYGGALHFATDHLVPKLEIGQDSKKNKFAILGTDVFLGKFSILPRFTFYSAAPTIAVVGDKAQSGSNYNLTVRWDDTSQWVESQGFHDSIMDANFYSLRYGLRFGKGFEFSCFAQKYEGKKNTLFGLYETMTGGTVVGTKMAIVL